MVVSSAAKEDFMELLSEQKGLSRKSHWNDVKKKIDHDPRYKVVESVKKEEWFKDFLRKLESGYYNDDESFRREKERKEREAASIKKREEEVKEALSTSLRERDKEREAQRREEAHTTFQALLHDLIKDSSFSWKEAKKVLEKDSRWEIISEILDRSERESVFKDHVSALSKRNKEVFHKLLAEKEDEIALDTLWKEARKLVKEDPRFEKYSSSDRKREHEYHRWQEIRFENAKNGLKELLTETKAITHKSRKQINNSDSHMKEILSLIEKDKRFTNLASFSESRLQIIDAYIDELDRRGPPPPPTASEPFRRK